MSRAILGIADFEFTSLAELLGLPLSNERIVAVLGPRAFKIQRDAYYGFIQLRTEGVDVVFQEAPWVLPPEQIVDEKALHLAAFHFHREGHEGYSGYTGALPNGVVFDDPESELRRKMGEPLLTGGGGVSTVLPGAERLIPRWIKYAVGDNILHLQLDPDGQLEMATLMTPDIECRIERRHTPFT
jgi:hypothetical protein